jgi:hypothetical protein
MVKARNSQEFDAKPEFTEKTSKLPRSSLLIAPGVSYRLAKTALERLAFQAETFTVQKFHLPDESGRRKLQAKPVFTSLRLARLALLGLA